MAQVQQVAPPQRKPRVGGIKDVSGEFVTENRLAASTGIVWEDSGCGVDLSATRAGCYDAVTPVESKEGTGVGQFTGVGPAFARYAGVTCWLGGDQEGPTYVEQARERLAGGEDRAVEAQLMAWAEDGEAVTGGSIVETIAALEQYADANYIGQPVLVMSREMADLAYAADALHREDGKLVSPNGTPVVASGAIESSAIAIIGWPAVYASEIVAAVGLAWSTNTELAIAERVYAIAVDCAFRAASTPTP